MTSDPGMLEKLVHYFGSLGTGFQRAAQAQPPSCHELHVYNVQLRLRIAGDPLMHAVMPALAHLAGEPAVNQQASITFDLWDMAGTGEAPPPPPFTSRDYRRYGQRAIAYAGTLALMCAPAAHLLFAYDRAARHGYFWTMDASLLSIYERAAPLQTLFHWALAEFGWQIVHAAAVGTASGGVLVIGSRGAGKSTTALSCLAQEGLYLLSDDKCLMRLAPAPRAFALFSSAKIKADMLDRLPQFRTLLSGWDADGDANKGMVHLFPTYTAHMLRSFPIKALLLPQVARRTRPAIRCVAPNEVFRQLGPSTVIWLPGAEADNYRFTAEVTRRLPCYRIELANDLHSNAAAIRELVEQL